MALPTPTKVELGITKASTLKTIWFSTEVSTSALLIPLHHHLRDDSADLACGELDIQISTVSQPPSSSSRGLDSSRDQVGLDRQSIKEISSDKDFHLYRYSEIPESIPPWEPD
ncbi:hypothetical protein Scep_022546 [Stephania cephalantha]|uniref:Uncharacterized protein n=1 Tax=Stephania cephalantha TaxID=152367 RepID=A0AAP0I117_9MAGN